MSDPYIGEIRMFAGNFAPAGWALCEGQLMAISENDALFILIGTTYGGDGQSTFALPDLRGRIPIHQGTGGGGSYVIGEQAGVETVTLTTSQLPIHSHSMIASSANNDGGPLNAYLAKPTTVDVYRPGGTASSPMSPSSIAIAGGSQPHDNIQPFLCVNFIISLFGIFPTQN
jgi:microcystin-dependent protein